MHMHPGHTTACHACTAPRTSDTPQPTPQITENFAYLPFGGGRRKCIGDQFALFETLVALAVILRRFDFGLAPGAPEVGMTTGASGLMLFFVWGRSEGGVAVVKVGVVLSALYVSLPVPI